VIQAYELLFFCNNPNPRTKIGFTPLTKPGYHLDQLQNLVNNAGFIIKSSGFSYGFTENMINNLSYFITEAKEKRKLIYAILFPIMNTISWFGQWSEPNFGAGVWVIAEKE